MLKTLIQHGEHVLLVGPPGTGKTARIRDIAADLGMLLFYGVGGRTCDLMDRLDAAGAVIPDMRAGVSRLLPLADLDIIMHHKGPGIWFLDELGRAPLDVQGALCSQIDRIRREQPEVRIIAATNRPGDRAGVSALSSQLESRFSCVFAMPTPGAEETADGAVLLHEWAILGSGGALVGGELHDVLMWGLDHGWPAEHVAWHRSTVGRTLYAWRPHADASIRMPDYRTWDTSARLWRGGMRDLRSQGATLGKPTAVEFLAFVSLAKNLPTTDQIILDPLGAPVPEDTSACYLVVSNLAAAATDTNIGAIVKYLVRLPRLFAALLGRDIYRRVGAKLSGTKEWITWFTENQALFNVRG